MELLWKKLDSSQTYPQIIDMMEETAHGIIEGRDPEQIWLVEHEDIYSAGTSFDKKDLLNHKNNNIPVYYTGRGGQYTYHGPGQRVVYFLLNLKNSFAPNKPDLKQFIFLLEEIIINTLRDIGIQSTRRSGRVGIWVDNNGFDEKIAAIGIRVRKWVSYHGIAINIAPDISKYSGIVPCGLSEFGITSLKKLKKEISFEEFDEIFKKNFYQIFVNYNKPK